MLPLKELGDELFFSRPAQEGIFLKARLTGNLKNRSPDYPLPAPRKNLIWKAASLFYKTIHKTPRIAITLHKSVPFGAGLGSGSSNAAYTLMTLNQMHGSPLSQKRLLPLAAALGSDVPFFLARGAALVEGEGDKITPVSFPFNPWFLIINPSFQISTRWAYETWDKRGPKRRVSLTKKKKDDRKDGFFATVRSWMAVKQMCVNDFGTIIFPAYPMLQEARHKLYAFGAQVASLSGSGPTLFGAFKRKTAAQRAARFFDQNHWLTWITQGV